MSTRIESMQDVHGSWTTSAPRASRPRPATIHEGFCFSVDGGFEVLPAWESSIMPMQPPSTESMSSRPISGHHDFYTTTTMENNTWSQKPCEDTLEIHAFDNEMNIGQAYTTDEAIPILDLQRPCPPNDENPNFEGALNHRRMSGSSFAMSTSGGLSDMPSYEDFAAAFSEVPSFGPASTRTSMLSSSSEFPLQSNRTSMLSTCSDYPAPSNRNSMISSTSDYPAPSNRNSLLSSTQLSPVASPRMTPQSRSDVVRTQSRGRASPSPRPGMRAAPYSIEGPRNKRWSTGTYGTGPNNRRPSPFIYHQPHDVFGQHNRIPTSHSSPIGPQNQVPLNYTNLQAIQQHPPYLMSNVPASFQRNSMFLPTQLPAQHGIFPPQPPPFDPPPTLLSNGHIHMLHSNGDPFSLHGHYANLSDPPDIYASSRGEPVDPPPEDMNPDDPDLVPHEQELRNEGDLYTPKWVRGHGSKREGWCGLCKPGRWLVLKNSAFWYDKSFTHGISAATGVQFQEPQEQRRMDGNPDIWEGLCGTCSEWIPLVSSKKKGTTWFRHSYKCHTHPKIKDAPKRRRESGRPTTVTAKPKTEPATPLTPQMTPASMSVTNTPTPIKAQPHQAEHGCDHEHHPSGQHQEPTQTVPALPPTEEQTTPQLKQQLQPPPMLHQRPEFSDPQVHPAFQIRTGRLSSSPSHPSHDLANMI